MMFKNSFRLFCANFDKVWKYLVYQLLCWGIVFALLAPFYTIIANNILEAWEGYQLSHYFASGTLYEINVVSAFSSVANAVITCVSGIFSTSLFCGIYCIIVLFFVKPFLSNIGKYTVCEMVYGYMSSSSKITFTGTLLRTLKKSLSYSALKALFTLPFNALILATFYGMTKINFNAFHYVLPLVIVLSMSLLLAIKETFIAGWAPADIVFDDNAAKAYRRGIKVILRRGFRVFSSAFVIFILTTTLAMVIGLYSLIIILPCITPLLCIFEMVAFFSSQGMRFYVDADTILTPKKLEEVDTIDKAKFLL